MGEFPSFFEKMAGYITCNMYILYDNSRCEHTAVFCSNKNTDGVLLLLGFDFSRYGNAVVAAIAQYEKVSFLVERKQREENMYMYVSCVIAINVIKQVSKQKRKFSSRKVKSVHLQGQRGRYSRTQIEPH